MRRSPLVTACLLAIGSATLAVDVARAEDPTRFDALADLPFTEGRPTPESEKILADELLFQRATQVYLWAMPLVNTLGMKEGSEQVFGAGSNVMPVWKNRLDAKTLVTTPNSDVIYALSYVDLGAEGPLVFEAPPLLQGILLDFWQRPIPVDGGTFAGDVGFAGPDGGKGGRFLLLPPGFEGDVPGGYHVCRSGTNNVFIFLRAFYEDADDLSAPVKLIEGTLIYPLGKKATAKPMVFPNASGRPANMLPRSDGTVFDQLKRLVESEGEHLADADGLGQLASIGIVKGEPFAPDDATRRILDRAARTAHAMSRMIGFRDTITGRTLRLYPDRRWVNPMAGATAANFSGPFSGDLSWTRTEGGFRDIDCRTWFFTNYYSVSPGMLSQVPGRGAWYAVAFADSDGAPLSGDATYRLRLPPDVPVANFWSLTLYDAATASGLANGQPFPSLGSRDGPEVNADGSTDIFIGPKSPPGREANWLATAPGRGFFSILRLYGPTEPALTGEWKPGDFEKRD